MSGVMALSGSSTPSDNTVVSRLHNRAMAAPQTIVTGISNLWFSVRISKRAICGTASPRNDTGPQ